NAVFIEAVVRNRRGGSIFGLGSFLTLKLRLAAVEVREKPDAAVKLVDVASGGVGTAFEGAKEFFTDRQIRSAFACSVRFAGFGWGTVIPTESRRGRHGRMRRNRF